MLIFMWHMGNQIDQLLSLRWRARDFAMAHVAPSFFREEAAGAQGPIGGRDLSIALQQAYSIRSSYVHLLRDVPRQLTISGFPEATEVDKATLSFAGLSRLARHIIMQFIAKLTPRSVFARLPSRLRDTEHISSTCREDVWMA